MKMKNLKNKRFVLMIVILIEIVTQFAIVSTKQTYCKHFKNNRSIGFLNSTCNLISKRMDIFLDDVRLKCQKTNSLNKTLTFTYDIQMYKGFDIKRSKLIQIENYDQKFIRLEFRFVICYFQFYKQTSFKI